MNEIELSEKQSIAWHYLTDQSTNEVLFGGAAGGGKSYFGCVWQIYRRTTYAGTRGLIARNHFSDIEDSTLVTFRIAAARMGYTEGVDFFYNGQQHTIVFGNGSLIKFKDLFYKPSDPDFARLGSTEYTDVFVDECTEITRKAFDIVNSRIRFKVSELGLEPKILMTCNPGPGWVKETFVQDKERRDVVLKPYQKFVSALLTDNPDPEFVKLYSKQLEKMTSDYDKRRLIHGDWDAQREVRNAFAMQYDSAKHESELAVFQPNTKLLINIDFNLNPFAVTFAHVFRDNAGEHVHIFDEAKIENGSLQKMADLIRARYKNQLPGCLITGDSLGNNRQINQVDNSSYYRTLQKALGIRENQIVVPNNPNHRTSREDFNYLLMHFPDFKINPKTCPNLCMDMRTVECDDFGDIIKANRKNESQRADFLDTARYLVNTHLKKWIVTHQNKK